ncbi:Transcriptional regulator, AraC family [Mesorhizobium sp. ORS 3359]|nr:Transcriptional regulator, AraC family [Mesorhizobium sp. ORS 3359]
MNPSGNGLDAGAHSVNDLASVFSVAEGPVISTERGAAAYSRLKAGSHTFKARHLVVYVGLEPALGVSAILGEGDAESHDAPAGGIILKPAHLEARLQLSKARESSIIVYPEDSLKELALQQFGSEEAELRPPPPGTLDHTALRVAQLLKAELTKEQGASEFYIERLLAILGVHLLHAYSSRDREPRQLKGGLGPRTAHALQDFLKANLTQKISVDTLADLANLSPRHFTQAFSRTFGRSPHRYLLDLRLDHAARLLAKGQLPIADVAYLSGFSSQSHLTAAMRKHRGTTPTRLRSSI